MDQTLDKLIARFRGGDAAAADAAATELYERFVGEMLVRVRRSLRKEQDPGAFDSEGIVQEGFRSFLSKVRKPDFDPRQGEVVGLLATIVMRKLYRAKSRPHPVSVDPQQAGAFWEAMTSLLDGEMTEQEIVAEVNATYARVLDDFTPRERKIVARFFDPSDERTLLQVAKEARCTLTYVEDVIDRFTEQLRQELARLRRDSAEGP